MTEPDSVPTVGILCALSVELSAVLSTFDTEPEKQFDTEGTTFHLGTVAGQTTVATCLSDQGTGLASASRHASALIAKFPSLRIKSNLRFMIGIAGGIPSEDDDVRLGDVVIATTVLNYGSGKKIPGGFQAKNIVYEAPNVLRNGIQSFKVLSEKHGTMLQQVINKMIANHRARYAERTDSVDPWPHPRDRDLEDNLFKANYIHVNASSKNCSDCDSTMVEYRRKRSLAEPLIHYGLIASADHLLKDPNMRQKLKHDHPDALAVDMESSALHQDEFIVVRGISDYADTHKNDDWQPKAAVAAAACSVLLIEHLPRSPQSAVGSPLLRQDTPVSPPAVAGEASFMATSPTNSSMPPWTSIPSYGLQRTRTRITEPASITYAWSHDFHFEALELNVSDIPSHGGQWDNGMLTLRESKTPAIHEAYREIVIKGNNDNNESTVIWLPLTHVCVKQSDLDVTVRFSNCNVREKDSHDWKELNWPVYDSSRPNVIITARFHDVTAATQMADKLLYRCIATPNHDLLADLQYSDLKIYKPKQHSHHEESQILISQLVLCEDEFEMIAFVHLDSYMEMNFDITSETISITFNDTAKISYQSLDAKSANWPPIAVTDNPSGEPRRYEFTGGKSSIITLKTSDLKPVRELFDNITDAWRLCAGPFKAQATSQSGLLKRAEAKDLVVTIWRRKGWVQILTRTLPQDGEVEWSCVKLQRQTTQNENENPLDDDDPKLIYEEQENRVIVNNIQPTRGNRLRRSTLQPAQSKNSKKEQAVDNKPLSLDFDTGQDMRNFLDALSEHASMSAHPQSNQRLSKTRLSISFGRQSRSSQDSDSSRRRSTIFRQNSVAEVEAETEVTTKADVAAETNF